MTAASAPHARLREGTRDGHARVDACFADGLHDAASYRRYLGGMHALLGALAASDALLAADYRHHRALLDDDLSALGLPAPAQPTAPIIDGEDARLGARYVIEGSAMGARLLLRQALALGHSPAAGARFLTYHVDRGTTHWPRLVHALAGLDPASSDFDSVLAAARGTFALAASCFDPMGPADQGCR